MSEHDTQYNSIEQVCHIIDLLRPCMNDYLYAYDFINDFYYISKNAAGRFSMPDNSFSDVLNHFRQFIHPEDFPALEDDLMSIVSGKKDFHNMDYRWMDTEGYPVWINCRGSVIKENNEPRYLLGCINEIGRQQKADNISGLLSKSSLQAFLTKHHKIRHGYILRLGLDDFKAINEKHGIEYGDMILKKTAECISLCISSKQKLYRIVADEFIILDLTSDSIDAARDLYRRIRSTINLFVEQNYYNAVFTISGGILPLDNDMEFSTIMKLSEFTLNEAKRRGKNRCRIFNEDEYTRFLRREELAKVLRQAVYNDFEGFEAYFQPLFYANTATLYGAEALMRFHSKEYGMISPAEFIPILEETGLIIPAGRWILHESLIACRNIQKTIPNFLININISPIQIMKSDIIDEVASAVTEYGIRPSSIVLELTESGLLESDSRFTKLWSRLKEQGIRLALDDFGTGYSNFHYLYDLRPDIIKIDRTFTAKALNNEYEYKLLSLMSGMVHNLNLKICVEGIETAEEQSRILTISPDFTQGFYFGRPCPYEQFYDTFVKEAV